MNTSGLLQNLREALLLHKLNTIVAYNLLTHLNVSLFIKMKSITHENFDILYNYVYIPQGFPYPWFSSWATRVDSELLALQLAIFYSYLVYSSKTYYSVFFMLFFKKEIQFFFFSFFFVLIYP